ncbi:glycosyltransferase family 4 protein [Effusibacillus lacus]|uniref:Glycosyl transferase family 1 n=1 Tax=Effusibacillus lacus TaxID=1348429 RepID=A0A292YKG9_9BACL|nr:glycosyltransferase family 4 protein [Effusibacillus lacus]TCS74937.1 glycosyltransferase involved in cell wall biosynthesis [Effusibacillus lacus]GAX91607.1 glycosyl transferase family 1 [Effusibacillus lacus]
MKRVSILTHSFLDAYNRRFSRIFGGGLERYIYDLCGVIKEMGYQPEVHQLSFFEPFRTSVKTIEVFGYTYDFDEIPEAFEKMASQARGALIYASCIWHPIPYRKNSLGISHGINWDRHDLPQSDKIYVAKSVQMALDQLFRIVSVDSQFLTFCRSVCTYTDPEQVILVPNSVDTNHFKPSQQKNPSDPVRVLFPRRISFERGIIPMMLATDRLLDLYSNLIVEFAGEVVKDSPIGDTFEIWMKEHPHRNRILHRTYPFDKIVQAYQQADVAVIPSIFSEGTSYSCLEAISCGVPVVASNVGGLNDILIDGFNGLLVAPTEERITEAIIRVIEDVEFRKELGANARKTALAFDKTVWKKRWTGLLQEYLETGGNL